MEREPDSVAPWRQLALWQRSGLVASALVAGMALAVAAMLTPSEKGLGTHQQLGLPPCSLRMLAGIRCPSCGMTTAWAHFMHGQPLRALGTNVGGTLLALGSLLYVPWALASGIRGSWFLVTPSDMVLAASSIAVLVVTVLEWGVRLYCERIS